MRNRQLHDALLRFCEEAAWQLAADACAGADVPYEVVETGEGGVRGVDGEQPFVVTELSSPPRLVVDVASG